MLGLRLGTAYAAATGGKAAIPATGIFFDTSSGDTFTGSKASAPVDATITTSANSIAFNSASVKALNFNVKRGDASILDFAFDAFTVDATITMNAAAATVGDTFAYVGTLNDQSSWIYAAELHAHPANASSLLNRIANTSAPIDTDGAGFVFTNGQSVRLQYTRLGNLITCTYSFPSTADHVRTITQTYTAGSFEAPRLFSKPLIQFVKNNITLTGLKVSALYPNAKFAFVGDSITQGRLASVQANSFAAKVRADNPGNVLICGAPSATTANWLPNAQDVVAMKPKYAFVLLGTNDDTGSVLEATREANYTTIINALIAGGATPIVLTCPPKNSSTLATFNTWLKAQGWRYIDIYPLLLGTGTAMNATYDSGDGIHPNDAGHTVIYNAIASYITAQGL